MRVLQIGLGSMGKRRVRNLQFLGYHGIVGFDIREDRRKEASHLYGVTVINSFDEVDWNSITHVIVSTPPDQHVEYALISLNYGKHVFIEASVVDTGYAELIELASTSECLLAPSCTMRFDPLNIKLKQWIDERRIGELLFSQHHFGLYLPKWHPYELIEDFYVSKRHTGAAREIVPFDMVYLIWLLGEPTSIKGTRVMTGVLDADIDDIYALTYRTDNCKLVQMTIDVVSQIPYRTTRIVGEKGNVELDTVKGTLSLFDAVKGTWEHHTRLELAETKSTEEMYVREPHCFIKASQGEGVYPYTIQEDQKILGYLYASEKADVSGSMEILK